MKNNLATLTLDIFIYVSQVPAILKTFYDEDILEEEILLEWGKKVSKKYVSKELSEQVKSLTISISAKSFLKKLYLFAFSAEY
jgi:translation initiation factor 5